MKLHATRKLLSIYVLWILSKRNCTLSSSLKVHHLLVTLDLEDAVRLVSTTCFIPLLCSMVHWCKVWLNLRLHNCGHGRFRERGNHCRCQVRLCNREPADRPAEVSQKGLRISPRRIPSGDRQILDTTADALPGYASMTAPSIPAGGSGPAP